MAGKLQELWEAQLGATVLWAPVALTFGIWTYFALPREPGLPIIVFFLLAALLLFWKARGRMGVILLAILLGGFVLAKFRAEIIATPLLKATTGEIVVSGIVHDVERASERRATLILEPDKIEGMTTAQLPRRLRLSNSLKNGEPAIGDRIAFKARLAPIASPTMPGGFDYGRQQYFEGIGGTGRITSKIDALGSASSASLWLSGTLHDLRHDIGSRIRQHLQGTIAAFAEALITGERASIPKDVNKSLQISGLFHILSISGLHMSLAAGGVFWLVRALLALFPVDCPALAHQKMGGSSGPCFRLCLYAAGRIRNCYPALLHHARRGLPGDYRGQARHIAPQPGARRLAHSRPATGVRHSGQLPDVFHGGHGTRGIF